MTRGAGLLHAQPPATVNLLEITQPELMNALFLNLGILELGREAGFSQPHRGESSGVGLDGFPKVSVYAGGTDRIPASQLHRLIEIACRALGGHRILTAICCSHFAGSSAVSLSPGSVADVPSRCRSFVDSFNARRPLDAKFRPRGERSPRGFYRSSLRGRVGAIVRVCDTAIALTFFL